MKSDDRPINPIILVIEAYRKTGSKKRFRSIIGDSDFF